MARTALAVQQINRAGLLPTYAAANVDGHSMPNGGQEVLHVKTGATGCTVTIETPGTVDGQAVSDRAIVLGVSTERLIGPFPPNVYNQGAGEVYINFSSVVTVTVAALRPS